MEFSRTAPEFASVSAFVQHLLDEDRTEFTHEELQALNFRLGRPVSAVRAELEAHGASLAKRVPAKAVRGFTSNPHDRWYGPGACRTHGGAAYTGMMVAKYGSKDVFG